MRFRRYLPRSEKKSRSARKPALPPRKFHSHPLYGEVPLVPRSYEDSHGRTHIGHQYDPDYIPSLPRGAVRGNPRKQLYGMHVPKYFYLDENKICVSCSAPFVFGAEEQKHWYETLKFTVHSRAIRCPDCRRALRREKNLRARIASAKSALKVNPDDPSLLLSLAENIALYNQRTGEGDLNEAISASRRARKLHPRAHEALFWEAVCPGKPYRQGSRVVLSFY